MTCRTEEGVAYIQTYNTENRISSIIKLASGTCAAPGPFAAKWDFAYDGDGVRVSTLLTPYNESGEPLTPEMISYYFGGAYETRSDSTNIKYYSFAGQTIGMDDGTGLQYFLTDHLGSVVATTDSTGTLISQQRYLPFGGVRPNVPTPSGPNTDLGYTGQRNLDEGIGLMDYKARFYSPYINRFVQPDSLIPNPSNPQAWNRFSYVYNNPVRYNDPTGHCATGLIVDTVVCADIVIAIVLVTAAIEVTIYYTNNTAQGELLRNRAVEGLENFVEMTKRKDPKQRTIDKIIANIGVNADSTKGWWPESGIDCESSASKALTCITIVLGAAKVGYDLLKYGDIEYPTTNTTSDPPTTSTPTSPSSHTPPSDCPPYLVCPSRPKTPDRTHTPTLNPKPARSPSQQLMRME